MEFIFNSESDQKRKIPFKHFRLQRYKTNPFKYTKMKSPSTL